MISRRSPSPEYDRSYRSRDSYRDSSPSSRFAGSVLSSRVTLCTGASGGAALTGELPAPPGVRGGTGGRSTATTGRGTAGITGMAGTSPQTGHHLASPNIADRLPHAQVLGQVREVRAVSPLPRGEERWQEQGGGGEDGVHQGCYARWVRG